MTPSGSFTWQHKDEKNIIKGSYTISREELYLLAEKEEKIKVKINITDGQLSLLTGDGFTFSFRKTSEGK